MLCYGPGRWQLLVICFSTGISTKANHDHVLQTQESGLLMLSLHGTAADEKNVEHTLEVFPSPQQAAKAHDVAALRQYGLAAETMLNFPLGSYSEVSSLMPEPRFV